MLMNKEQISLLDFKQHMTRESDRKRISTTKQLPLHVLAKF